MNPDEIKWAVLQIHLAQLRGELLTLLGKLDPKQNKDYERFMARVLKPLTKEDL